MQEGALTLTLFAALRLMHSSLTGVINQVAFKIFNTK